MTMDPAEDKFFENLANIGQSDEKPEAEEKAGVEVELVKTPPTVTTPKSKGAPKAAREGGSEPEGQLTIDVYQTQSEIIVESAIAGVKPEDIDVNVSSDSITVRGERRREQEIKEDDYLYQECYWGRFSRSIILPQEIDPEGASVNFKNGILTVHLPKLNRKKSKQLKVKIE